MNVFELSAIASPLVGAITGGVCVRTSGAFPTLLGVALGLVIGVVLYFGSMRFTGFMLRVPGVSTKTEGLSPFQWLASLAGVLMPAAAPFAAWTITFLVITRLLHL